MDKRTQAKIRAQNVPINVFKLRTRQISFGYSLFYEVCRQNLPRKRGALHLIIKGSAGSYYEDVEIIQLARRKLDTLEKMYRSNESLSFMDANEKKKIVSECSFYTIFQEYYIRKYKKHSTQKNFITTLSHLKNFNNGKELLVKNITKEFSFNLKNYLDRLNLANSTKNSYLQKYKEVVAYLVENKHINDNPIPKRFSFKNNLVDRQYLEELELIKLMKTPHPQYSETVCQGFVFACFSGLRWEDLTVLKFDDIVIDLLKIKQGKTDEYVEFQLPPQAMNIVHSRRKYRSDLVFDNLGSNYRGNRKIKVWVKNAKISKTVTWHVARHTFACLLLLKGVDIFHLMKLLGHTDIKSTMKYLHVLKEHKAKATEALSGIGLTTSS